MAEQSQAAATPPSTHRVFVIVGYTAVLAFLLVIAAETGSDADLWGHLRFGQEILGTRTLPDVDRYAFTSDRPWINHEWLAEVAMASAYDAAGVAGLLALKGALLLASLIVAARALDRAAGGRAAGVAVFGLVGLMGVLPLFGTVRPQGFSVLLFTIEAAILASPRPRLLALVPLFAVWANLHGGWVMGLGSFGVWLALSLLRPAAREHRIRSAAAGVAAVLATLINPYGVELWIFLWDTVGFARPDIVEWRSLVRLPELLIPWIITTGLASWVVLTRRASLPAVGVSVLLAVASFRVGRMVPFYSLATGLMLMPTLPVAAASVRRLWLLPAAALAATIAATAAVGRDGAVNCWQPTFPVDPQAHAFIRTNGLEGRLAVWFNWGEYVIWHFPRLSVSMDGRRETVYSDATLAAHREFYNGSSSARAYLDELSPDYVWLPSALPVSRLMTEWGWRGIFKSEHSMIWTRRAQDYQPPGALLAPCFPGP